MATIPITIDNEKLSDWVDTAKWLWNIPQIANPDYVDPDTTPLEPEFINEFTDNEWAKIGLLRWGNSQIQRRRYAEDVAAIDTPYEDILT